MYCSLGADTPARTGCEQVKDGDNVEVGQVVAKIDLEGAAYSALFMPGIVMVCGQQADITITA